MAASPEKLARFYAAHEAYRVVEQHGYVEGAEILKGYACAFALALGACIGKAEARSIINDAFPKPYLVVNNDQPAA